MKLAQLFRKTRRTKKERGYAMMVGLMATLTISIIGLNAAAPQIAFDAQREREEELLWRGAQIGNALLAYRSARGGQFPTGLEELVEGVNTGVKTSLGFSILASVPPSILVAIRCFPPLAAALFMKRS